MIDPAAAVRREAALADRDAGRDIAWARTDTAVAVRHAAAQKDKPYEEVEL